MIIKYNVSGKERKKLVNAIARWLECDVKYLGAPTFAYRVDNFTIDKDGNLAFEDKTDSEIVERLLEHLYDEGYECENIAEEPQGIAIQMPLEGFDDGSLKNLRTLVEAKGNLIKKAIGVNELPINILNDRLDFPWFPEEPTPDEVKTYMHFITALCNLAKKQKRVTVKKKDVDNEKYAFRCFLLRLGFIGNEYKEERKILLHRLTGSTAFKNGKKDEEVKSCE